MPATKGRMVNIKQVHDVLNEMLSRLTRYDEDWDDSNETISYCHGLRINNNGQYVKFDDVKKLLTTHNNLNRRPK